MIWGNVSISDAAELLTNAGDVITRSALSRYADKNADSIEKQQLGKEHLVDFEALAELRKRDLDSPAFDLWAKVAEKKPSARDRRKGLKLWREGKEIKLDFDVLRQTMSTHPIAPYSNHKMRGR